MALPRSAQPVCAPRHCGPIQTNHPRAALVFHTAAAHHPDVYGCFQQYCRHFYRRRAAHALLLSGRHQLELLRRGAQQNRHHFQRQPKPIRQGLFSALGSAPQHRHLQFSQIRHPATAVFWILLLLYGSGRRSPAQWRRRPLPPAAAAVGGLGPRLWPHRHQPHHQVPRPGVPAHLCGAVGHVRHSGHLSALGHTGRVSMDRRHQPHDGRHRDL